MSYTIKSKQLPVISLVILAVAMLTTGISAVAQAATPGIFAVTDQGETTNKNGVKTEQIDCGNGITAYRKTGQSSAQACANAQSSADAVTSAAANPNALKTGDAAGSYSCGGPHQLVPISIDIGCRHAGNPIADMAFAIIRLLSNAVGLIVVGSITVAGIQYTMSAGDPQSTAKAIGRIRASIMALALYIFAYPLLNYLLPMGFFK